MQRVVAEVFLSDFKSEVNALLKDGWKVIPASIRADVFQLPGRGAFVAFLEKSQEETSG